MSNTLTESQYQVFFQSIGSQLKRIAKDKGFTYTMLENATGHNHAQYSLWFNGKVNISLIALFNICYALEVNAGDIVKKAFNEAVTFSNQSFYNPLEDETPSNLADVPMVQEDSSLTAQEALDAILGITHQYLEGKK